MSIEGTTWTLTSVDGAEPVAGEAATLTLSEGRAAGSTGCNRFTGTYVLDGGSISFGRLATTRMACPGELAAHRVDRALGRTRRDRGQRLGRRRSG